MRNILTIIAISTLTFITTNGQAQNIGEQSFNTQESVSYKAVIAFNKNKKANKDFQRAFNNLQERVEGQDIQVIKAKKKMVTLTQGGKVILEVNIADFIATHGQGFLILSNDQEPQVISDTNSSIVNEDTIADIALISLGLNQYEDLVIAF